MNTQQPSPLIITGVPKQPFLSDRVIGVSISESPDLEMRGFGPMHLQDAMVEFARYLLAGGATLAYGGDLRKGGFTEILFDLVKSHNRSEKPPWERIINYQAWPIHLKLTTQQKADLKKVSAFKPLDPPYYLNVDPNQYIAPASSITRYIWAHCLTAMRLRMNRAIDARIVLGGKVFGYSGKYPGIAEEALVALRAQTPLYLIGGFGGCAHVVIQALLGEKPPELTLPAQTGASKAYGDLVDYYNTHIQTLPSAHPEPIDYEHLVEYFHRKGIRGLNNGLNEDDNRRLFETVHIPEMISLILKGLSQTN